MTAQRRSRGLRERVDGSCCEPFVSEPLSCYRVHERVEALEGVASDVALIQPERKFVNVASKMLFADLVVDTVQSTLEDCPDALNAVCGGVPANVLTRRVVNALLAKEQTVQVVVGSMLIGEESRADFDVAVNGVLDFLHADRLEGHRLRSPAALSHSEYRSFANRAASEILFVGLMLVDFQAADESLVDLDGAAQFVQFLTARFAETVKDEPRRLLSDANFLRQLHRRDSLPRGNEQVHGIEPLVKGHMRPLENSSCPHREVQFAGVAAVVAVLADSNSLHTLALRAGDAIWPETAFEIHASRCFIGVHLEEFEGANC